MGNKNKDLLKAAKSGNLQKVKELLDAGTNPNVRDDYGRTALILTAACRGWAHIVELLLDRGADINAKDKQGWTVLMWAAYFNNTNAVKLLKQHGAN